LKGKGFAITGIVLPAASVPILMAMLMPALGKARETAQRVVCAANLQMLGNTMMVYANDYDGQFPTADKWCDLLVEEVGVDPMVFKCKSALEGRCNYAMDENITRLGRKSPGDIVLVFESEPGWNLSGGVELLTADNHCGVGANILFADGHVEFVKSEDFGNLIWIGNR